MVVSHVWQLAPDLVLASTDIGKDTYDELSEFAPTVFWQEESVDKTIATTAKALGKETEGNDLIQQLKDVAAKHSGLRGKKFLFGSSRDSDEVIAQTKSPSPVESFLQDYVGMENQH